MRKTTAKNKIKRRKKINGDISTIKFNKGWSAGSFIA